MSIPSSPPPSKGAFKATIAYPEGNFDFIANKASISQDKDSSKNECWRIVVFQDILKNPASQTKKLIDIKEVISIQLYIPKDRLFDDQNLTSAVIDTSLNDPNRRNDIAFNKNSGNLLKIIDDKPDINNTIDTTVQYPGTSGSIVYQWDEDFKRIFGVFALLVKSPDEAIIQILGRFNLSNALNYSI